MVEGGGGGGVCRSCGELIGIFNGLNWNELAVGDVRGEVRWARENPGKEAILGSLYRFETIDGDKMGVGECGLERLLVDGEIGAVESKRDKEWVKEALSWL